MTKTVITYVRANFDGSMRKIHRSKLLVRQFVQFIPNTRVSVCRFTPKLHSKHKTFNDLSQATLHTSQSRTAATFPEFVVVIEVVPSHRVQRLTGPEFVDLLLQLPYSFQACLAPMCSWSCGVGAFCVGGVVVKLISGSNVWEIAAWLGDCISNVP